MLWPLQKRNSKTNLNLRKEGVRIKKKRITLVVISTFIIVFLLFVGNRSSKYNEKDFVGKTSTGIINQYGQFDFVTVPPKGDSLYKSCTCGYIIQKSSSGFWGTSREMMFFIVFDESGIAINCFESEIPAV